MSDRSFYKILGVPFNASNAEIRRGYRQKAMEFHPDRSDLHDAHARFLEIQEAYEVLGDPDLKASYDRTFFESYADSHSETFEWKREERERQERERQEQERRERLERKWYGRNFYEILGAPIHASEEEISEAFLQRYIAFRGDRDKRPDEEAKFQELNEAYQVLKTPDLKALYDRMFFASGGYSHSETSEWNREEQESHERSRRESDPQEWERWERDRQESERQEGNWGPIGRLMGTVLFILLIHGICFGLRQAAN